MKKYQHPISPEKLEKIKTAYDAIQLMITELTTNIQPAIEGIKKMQDTLANTFKDIEDGIKKIQEETPEATKIMADYGWYPTMYMLPRDTIELADKIRSGKLKTVDSWMANHLNEYYNNIKAEILKRFPKRRRPLNEAYWAHENKKYYLSVPVFLAQADGICKELTNASLFGGKKQEGLYKPHTYQWAQQITSDIFISILVEPLKHKGGLNKHERDPKVGNLVTRHEILHGANFDYGTKVLSYRAFSLLNFLVDIVYKAKKILKKKSLVKNIDVRESH